MRTTLPRVHPLCYQRACTMPSVVFFPAGLCYPASYRSSPHFRLRPGSPLGPKLNRSPLYFCRPCSSSQCRLSLRSPSICSLLGPLARVCGPCPVLPAAPSAMSYPAVRTLVVARPALECVRCTRTLISQARHSVLLPPNELHVLSRQTVLDM